MIALFRYIPLVVILRRVWKRIFAKDKSGYWATSDMRTVHAHDALKELHTGWTGTEAGHHSEILDSYRKHQFDLLGSGPIGWTLDQEKVHGFDGLQHPFSPPDELPGIFQGFNEQLDQEFGKQKILDWQRDMRSGFRFPLEDSAFHWGKYTSEPGSDVKVCWEFGRLQHLPRMAWFSDHPEEDFALFRNTVVDLWRNNPPGMGVQWGCAMDVGIRAINLILAYAIWKERGQGDPAFNTLFADILRWHGRFIFRHPEEKEGLSNNHFLFNLCGLAFCALILKREDKEVREWIAYLNRHLETQTLRQFHEDGGNFEGSIPYHFFSLECVLWTWNALSELGITPSEQVQSRLSRAISLCEDVLLPDGSCPQIGDNDSGALLRITYQGDAVQEDLLERSAQMDVFRTAMGQEPGKPEGRLFQKIGVLRLPKSERKNVRLYDGSALYLPEYSREQKFHWTAEEGGLNFFAYPDYGIYIWKNSRDFIGIYLPIRKGHPSRGHRHADDGHVELWLDGKAVWRDPGSFCYTAAPDWRNKFRSSAAHHTAFTGAADLDDDGVFYLRDQVRTKILALQPDRILAEIRIRRTQFLRELWFQGDELTITDHSDRDWKEEEFEYFSPAYGTKIKC